MSEDSQSSMPHLQRDKRSLRAILNGIKKYRILQNQIKPFGSGRIGRGGKGDIKLSKLVAPEDEDDPFASEAEVNVAVKTLKFTGNEEKDRMLGALVHEFKIMAELSHPNIIDAIGFVEDVENDIAWVVLPWEANGNVREFLSSGEWEVPERISLIKDVADGLNYLHSRDPPICHGDLKSQKILVNALNRAVITDFGSARTLGSTKEKSPESPLLDKATIENSESIKVDTTSRTELTLSGPAWSLCWAAPEVLSGECPDLPGDIWAFGWVCWEIVTAKLPFPESNFEPAIVVKVIRRQLPQVLNDKQASQIVRLCTLMTACWASHPTERPNSSYCKNKVRSTPTVVPSNSETTAAGKIRSVELLTTLAGMEKGQGHEHEAISLYNQALKIARSTAEEPEIAAISLGLGDACKDGSKVDQAMDAYNEVLSISFRLGDQRGVADAAKRLGNLHASRSELSKAPELYVKAVDIFSQLEISAQPGERDAVSVLLGQGHIYMAQGRGDQAESRYTEARDRAAKLGDEDSRSDALQGLGDVSFQKAEFQTAIRYYVEAMEIFTRAGNKAGRGSALYGLGKAYIAQDDFTQAIPLFKEALELASSLGAGRARANAIAELGYCFAIQPDYEQAAKCYDEAMKIYTEIDDVRGRANTLCSIGVMRFAQSRHDEALPALQEALAIFTSVEQEWGMARAYRGLGQVYEAQSKAAQAIEAYSEAAKLFESNGRPLRAADVLQELGNLHAAQVEGPSSEEADNDNQEQSRTKITSADAASHFAQAVAALSKANQIWAKGRHHSLRTGVLLKLGSLYERLGKHSKAGECYREANVIYSVLGKEDGKAVMLLLLGQVHAALSQYAKAEEYYAQAKESFTKLGRDFEKAGALNGLGDAYFHQEELEKAQAAYTEAGNLCVRIKEEDGKASALIGLANIFGKQKEFYKAEAALVRARRILSAKRRREPLANTILALARVYSAQSKHFKAENFFIQAEDHYMELQDEEGVADTCAGRGDLLMRMSLFSGAEKFYKKARDQYERLRNVQQVKEMSTMIDHAERFLKAAREARLAGPFGDFWAQEEAEERAKAEGEAEDDDDNDYDD